MKNSIEYTIEPAKGQALLNFRGRRLPDKIELFETSLIEEVRQKGQKKLHTDSRYCTLSAAPAGSSSWRT